MSKEILVCMSFSDIVDTSDLSIPLSGKQYCWMDESDYERLKEESISIHIRQGHNGCNDVSAADLKFEKVVNQRLINAVLELGCETLSSCKITICDRIGYRSHPRGHEILDKYNQPSGIIAKIVT